MVHSEPLDALTFSRRLVNSNCRAMCFSYFSPPLSSRAKFKVLTIVLKSPNFRKLVNDNEGRFEPVSHTLYPVLCHHVHSRHKLYASPKHFFPLASPSWKVSGKLHIVNAKGSLIQPHHHLTPIFLISKPQDVPICLLSHVGEFGSKESCLPCFRPSEDESKVSMTERAQHFVHCGKTPT